MGAEMTVDLLKGKTIQEAFTAAQRGAAYEYGSGGYTGSIAEARSHSPLRTRAVGISGREAELFLDEAEKWGPALTASRVDEATLAKREVTVKLPFKGDLDNFLRTWVKNNPAKVLVGYEVVDTTKRVTGAVKPAKVIKTYSLDSVDNARPPFVHETHASITEARKSARHHARKGVAVAISTTEREVYEALTERTFAVVLKTRAVLKSTRARKGEWWAMGCYSS